MGCWFFSVWYSEYSFGDCRHYEERGPGPAGRGVWGGGFVGNGGSNRFFVLTPISRNFLPSLSLFLSTPICDAIHGSPTHQSRVDRLILLSPAGIPNQAEDPGNGASASASASAADKPASVDATASATHNAARELTEPQQETQHGGPLTEVNQIKIHSNGNTGGGKSQTTTDPIQKIDAGDISSSASIEKKSSRSSSASDPPSPSKVPAPKGPPPLARKFITYMWDSGFSPFSLIRAFGPWGPLFVGKYSSRRFGSLSPDDTRDLHGYIWTISRAKGSSEYCISHLLAPGAYARMPLVERVDKLKIPVTFVYGDKDWMDPKGGLESIERMKKAGNDAGKLVMIKNAGHHLYLDNAKVSNRMLTEEITAAATPKEKEGRT